ncbi:hypothetical protein SBV1_810040 [Verrucomicrobia bacterium]|nr:hypothetical protein SBV1_810040 [Verrucomicrobiota bacterium]
MFEWSDLPLAGWENGLFELIRLALAPINAGASGPEFNGSFTLALPVGRAEPYLEVFSREGSPFAGAALQ